MPFSTSQFLSRRSFLARSVTTAGILTSATTLLDACGSNTTSSPSSSGPTTVTVMYQDNEFSKDYLAQFHKLNPDITINFVQYDPTRLAASFAAGNPPDFVRVFGATDMPNLVARGLATNLDSYFASSKILQASQLVAVNDNFRFDGLTQSKGSLYGMAKDWSQDLCFWYNKKLFDQAKVTYPSETNPLTYDEFLDMGKRLTVRNGDKVQTYGLDVAWSAQLQGRVLQMVAQQGASVYNSDLSKADFTTHEARKALQWYVDWAKAKVGSGPLVPDASASWSVAFPADRSAMVQFGFWFGGEVDSWTQIRDHVGFAPAPVMGTTRVSSCVSATGAYIPSKAKHKDAAWKVMEYFMGGQPAIDRAKSGFGLPTLQPLFEDIPQTLPYQKQAYQTTKNELQYFQTLRFSPYISDSAASSAIANAITSVAQGQTTFDQMVTQLNSTINLLLQQGQQQVG